MKKSICVLIAVAIALSGVPALAGDFTDNGDKTVTDKATSLAWQQAEPGRMKWQEATDYCAGLSLGGKDDWRLPTLAELMTLIDESMAQPMTDMKYFPDFPPTGMFYWTSDETEGNPYKAKGVIFNTGVDDNFLKNKKDAVLVRCVRK